MLRSNLQTSTRLGFHPPLTTTNFEEPSILLASHGMSSWLPQSFDRPHQQIRVLWLTQKGLKSQIAIRTAVVELDSDIDFRALSYTWGAQGVLHNISVDNQDLPVGQNLYEALQQLCTEAVNLPIWIDAICINQNDASEKSFQVPLMGRIYSKASKVVVWLGAVPKESAFLPSPKSSSSLKWTPQKFQLSLKRLVFGDFVHRRCVIELLRRPYWRRVWIIQELLLSKNVELRYGSSTIQWQNLDESYKKLEIWRKDVGILPEKQEFQAFAALSRAMKAPNHHSRDLLSLLREHINSQCTEPRDRVFGMFGLAKECCIQCTEGVDYDIDFLELLRRIWSHSFVHDNEQFYTSGFGAKYERGRLIHALDDGSSEYQAFKESLTSLEDNNIA